ncbi:MAG: glutamate synthase large subunit [Fidelibacterota bacterium]
MIRNIPFRRFADGSLPKQGLYDPRHEHDSCGIGFVADLDGIPKHRLISDGIMILTNLEHRGAVGGDKATGDGAGLLIQIPDEFFRLNCSEIKLPAPGEYSVAMVFLPTRRQLAERCRKLIERTVESEGCEMLGWRQVPTDRSGLGALAKSTEPVINQLFIARGSIAQNRFEQKLYVIRRSVEKAAAAWKTDTTQFYISSMSSRIIVYKGLLTGTQLPQYYPDLCQPTLKSAFTLLHQRFSTNTLPGWNLAQPFRYIAHNGEINTLQGNIFRMKAREAFLKSPVFGEDIEKLKPIILESGSDSAIFDNVLELLVLAGRSLPHAMMMMVPEAYGPRIQMSEDKRAFYEFHSSIMEPWDGPASLVFTDGRYIGGTLDRNGLRPSRYTITKNGCIVMASESGVLDFRGGDIRSRGRLQPGKMFLVDLQQNRVIPDNEIKAKISRQKPYRRWIRDKRIELRGLFAPSHTPRIEKQELLRLQHSFGYTDEELLMIINPMASRGQEAIGSMGNDTPLAVLSSKPQLLFNYFKQRFAQVTNPPIDPLREELVMSLESFLGRESNLLEETPDQYRGLKLAHPILTIRDMLRMREAEQMDLKSAELNMLFTVTQPLEEALEFLFRQAEMAIKDGASLLILTDRQIAKDQAAIPSLLAAAGLHHHLIRKGLRNSVGIIVETAEVREVFHFALLIGYGVDAVCPYLALYTVRDLAESKLLEREISAVEAQDAYITAVKKGLLKTFSRMGISTVHSFFGSQIFEALGLDRSVVDTYFTGTPSRIGGIGLNDIAKERLELHIKGFPENGEVAPLLESGGNYRLRTDGEKHFWNTETIYKLQHATRVDSYSVFKEYTTLIDQKSADHRTLRSLLTFKPSQPIPLHEVEPVENIVKRFVSAAMSFGSISREAHETIAIAMNRLGARSNSGEGGEDPVRSKLQDNGDSLRSRIRQIASGRFGVTTEYLIHADEIQIKTAQGAKPGEGGQLPGHKVSLEIAAVRHTIPGVTLISPPPHHDIYSIEDLAQLIYDLKTINPTARISVKLVSEAGVGTIAAGVAKGKADTVLICGQDGGTGASPLTAIKHAGLPWELGLAEVQQVLTANRLRDRIRVQVDGQLKTGRDLAIAALLGAEEFGFGTSLLITLGCVMMRKCHLNTCPVGIGTQNPALRARFSGKPEYVERFLRFIAQELREYMAMLGFKTLDDMVGHSELLDLKPATECHKAQKLDFSNILYPKNRSKQAILRCTRQPKIFENSDLETRIMTASQPALDSKKPVKIDLPVRNIHRTVGTRLSGEIVKKYGAGGLPDHTIRINLKGSAGQSLGAFLCPGITIHVHGDANDYLGKGMSGGRIIVTPPAGATFPAQENIICGNVVLYGATGGEIYINGIAGERFCVRNSGASAVVEGIGDHGCEYMTGGTAVIIGQTGKNFAAGMSGGIAYVYDRTEMFDTLCNLDMVNLESVWSKSDQKILYNMLNNHVRYTDSRQGKMILENWDAQFPLFVKVMPIDYQLVLERMRLQEHPSEETVSATEEVY